MAMLAVLLGAALADSVFAAPSPSATRALDRTSSTVTSQYYIGPEDVLEVNVWRNTDLSKVVTVRPDGRISLPLVGDVRASGMTPGDLTKEILKRLRTYMESPSVSVILQEVNSYSVYVMGQVMNPGRYFLKQKTTLLQAITLAGGFTALANKQRIVILRSTGPTTEERLTASYSDIVLKDGGGQNVILKPGDTVVVPSETMVLLNE